MKKQFATDHAVITVAGRELTGFSDEEFKAHDCMKCKDLGYIEGLIDRSESMLPTDVEVCDCKAGEKYR